MNYFYIAATIAFTAYGQLVLKWRISQFAPLPDAPLDKLKVLISLIFDPIIFSGFLAGFLAALAWMTAMTKFQLSHAYPFMSLSFVLVIGLSIFLLGEPLTWQKCLGASLIVAGTVVLGYV
jgi:uncharacterized membrane protein